MFDGIGISMVVNSSTVPVGIPPANFVYERRATTLSTASLIPSDMPAYTSGNISGYTLLNFQVPPTRDHFLLWGVGTD